MIHIIHFTATKVGGACSHLGSIGPKVGGALAPLALWLPRPCMFGEKERKWLFTNSTATSQREQKVLNPFAIAETGVVVTFIRLV